jgi:hypothetical protein
MAKDKWNMVFDTNVGKPVPAKNAFNTDDNVIKVGKDQFEEQLRIGIDVLMNLGFAFLIEDTDIHFSGVQVNTAVVLVLLVVEFHGLAAFW